MEENKIPHSHKIPAVIFDVVRRDELRDHVSSSAFRPHSHAAAQRADVVRLRQRDERGVGLADLLENDVFESVASRQFAPHCQRAVLPQEEFRFAAVRHRPASELRIVKLQISGYRDIVRRILLVGPVSQVVTGNYTSAKQDFLTRVLLPDLQCSLLFLRSFANFNKFGVVGVLFRPQAVHLLRELGRPACVLSKHFRIQECVRDVLVTQELDVGALARNHQIICFALRVDLTFIHLD